MNRDIFKLFFTISILFTSCIKDDASDVNSETTTPATTSGDIIDTTDSVIPTPSPIDEYEIHNIDMSDATHIIPVTIAADSALGLTLIEKSALIGRNDIVTRSDSINSLKLETAQDTISTLLKLNTATNELTYIPVTYYNSTTKDYVTGPMVDDAESFNINETFSVINILDNSYLIEKNIAAIKDSSQAIQKNAYKLPKESGIASSTSDFINASPFKFDSDDNIYYITSGGKIAKFDFSDPSNLDNVTIHAVSPVTDTINYFDVDKNGTTLFATIQNDEQLHRAGILTSDESETYSFINLDIKDIFFNSFDGAFSVFSVQEVQNSFAKDNCTGYENTQYNLLGDSDLIDVFGLFTLSFDNQNDIYSGVFSDIRFCEAFSNQNNVGHSTLPGTQIGDYWSSDSTFETLPRNELIYFDSTYYAYSDELCDLDGNINAQKKWVRHQGVIDTHKFEKYIFEGRYLSSDVEGDFNFLGPFGFDDIAGEFDTISSYSYTDEHIVVFGKKDGISKVYSEDIGRPESFSLSISTIEVHRVEALGRDNECDKYPKVMIHGLELNTGAYVVRRIEYNKDIDDFEFMTPSGDQYADDTITQLGQIKKL